MPTKYLMITSKPPPAETVLDAALGTVIVKALELVTVISKPSDLFNTSVVTPPVAVAPDIGFCWNEQTESYDLYSDEQTWSLNVPPARFMDKVNQQYSRMLLHSAVKDEGFEVAEEWEMDDNSIELTVTRWID